MVAVARKRSACEARGRRGAALRRGRRKRRRGPRLAGAHPGARRASCRMARSARWGRPMAVSQRPSPPRALASSKRSGSRTWTPSTSRSWSIPTIRTGESRRAATCSTCIERLARRGGVLIVDEAFADFDGRGRASRQRCPRAARSCLRSFGKAYGLAGLRLGFALASPDIVPSLRAALGPVAGQRAGDRDRGSRARRFGLARGHARAPRQGRSAARRPPARRRLADHRRNAPVSAGRACRTRAPPSSGCWPQESSPALSPTLRTGCDSGFPATRTHGNGSPRRFEAEPNRSSTRPACLPARAA